VVPLYTIAPAGLLWGKKTPKGEQHGTALTSEIDIKTHVNKNNRLFDAIVLWT
jgi:hypothetical protein